jgi:hypothetical protein
MKGFPGFITAFEGLELPHELLRRRLIAPKTGFPGPGFYLRNTFTKGLLPRRGLFKDASRFLRFLIVIPRWARLIRIATYYNSSVYLKSLRKNR